MEICEAARQCAGPLIEKLGYELVDAEYAMQDGLMCLCFYIWKQGGVSLDDCEQVSRAIEAPIEQADVTQGRPYCLCVSSPGERALKTEKDFERNLGACVTVELKSALKGKKKKFRGKLLSYGDKVIINTGKENETFENENIASVSPYIGF